MFSIVVIRKWLAGIAFFLAVLPGASWAQSACTAIWATLSATQQIAYYNNSAGTAAKWTALPFTLLTGSNVNALAGDSTTGLLWFYDRTGFKLYSVNLNTYAVSAGVALTTAAPGGNGNILGATFDPSGNLYLLAANGTNYYLSQVSNKATGTNSAWSQILYTSTGLAPSSGGSGDIVVDQSGQAWLATNTNPTAIYPLTLGTARVGTSVTYTLGNPTLQGIAVNPVNGNMFIGGITNGSITFQINPSVANQRTLTDATSTDPVTDMGNCVAAPAPPTVTKSFSPAYQALSGSTATLSLSFGNSNSVPLWLNATFKDVLPAGMVIGPVPSLNTGACAASTTVTNVITATAGSTSVTFAVGGRIPAGGCTISFAVSATASVSAYTNTIAVGDLSTTAGSNAAGSTATYKVGTDFAAAKSQCLGTCGTPGTGVITVPGGQTMQYVLTIANSSSGGTGSATFTDTLPTLMTPVLSISAAMTGGGACATASAVISGATQITGTLTNAPLGAACTVTVTTLVSKALSVSTNVTNTLTLAPTTSTSDTSATNNTATVPTTVGPSTLLTITKTNSLTGVTAGATISYTVTVVNSGPAAAPGATVTDPPATGLSCTTVTCSSTAGASCPSSPFPFTNLSTGVQITPTFAANSTATFVVTCGVTATGQ